MGDEAFGAQQWNPADSLRTGGPSPLPSISTLIGSESGDPCPPVGGGPSGPAPLSGSPASFGNAAALEVVLALVGVVFPVVVAKGGEEEEEEEGRRKAGGGATE